MTRTYIAFVCGKDFLMKGGDIAFKKGNIYLFELHNDIFSTTKDEKGAPHHMNFEGMFIGAAMVPLEALEAHKRNKSK